jgi:hypothetical protein
MTIITLFFLITYAFNSISNVSNTITHVIQIDGFGSQFQNIIATVAYAELNGKKYAYTPFYGMEHNYSQDAQFLEKKEELINFKNNFELSNPFTPNVTINCKLYFDEHLEVCVKTAGFKKIKTVFRSNKQKSKYFDVDHLHIAVHVRRHNIHDCRIEGTNTPDSVYLNTIEKLRKKHAVQNPQFHIYSQGNPVNFDQYRSADTIFHLNESLEDTFTQLVLADILIMSQSSLSYTAGLISDGIIYYIPFWHKPLSHWIKIDA